MYVPAGITRVACASVTQQGAERSRNGRHMAPPQGRRSPRSEAGALAETSRLSAQRLRSVHDHGVRNLTISHRRGTPIGERLVVPI